MIIVWYAVIDGFLRTSLKSIPSVMYLIFVLFDVQLSKRIAYPTSLPKLTPSSSATRVATATAATQRGCVHPISDGLICLESTSSDMNCGNLVVFPHPVSPAMIKILFFSYASINLHF